MELSHKFTVPATVEVTWAAFNDLEMVAGCFPGATLTSVEGDEFKGSCKVKLGPISLVYSGTGKFVQRDESTHRFVLEALGKDKRGNGTAGATVTARMTSATPDRTDVEVTTDLSITGKPAQFGRGVIQDVSDKLLRQFVTCLESKVGASDAADHPAGEAASTLSTAEVGTHRAESPSDIGTTAPAGGEHRSEQPRPVTSIAPQNGVGPSAEGNDALDLGATVVPVLLKAYGKQLATALIVLVLIKKLRGRRR